MINVTKSVFCKKDIVFKYVDKVNYIYFGILFVNESGIIKTFKNPQADSKYGRGVKI